MVLDRSELASESGSSYGELSPVVNPSRAGALQDGGRLDIETETSKMLRPTGAHGLPRTTRTHRDEANRSFGSRGMELQAYLLASWLTLPTTVRKPAMLTTRSKGRRVPLAIKTIHPMTNGNAPRSPTFLASSEV